jgi:CubicO group peptidase (beta-lactamase class C family)
LPRIAPTARDEEGRADPGKNPDLDHLLRGTVQDTTARRMGGVAGHAGVFSTARDVSIFAQALLDRLAGRPSEFPLAQTTLELMTAPQQPGHTPQQLKAANDAARAALAKGPNRSDPLLAPRYPAIAGQNLRGFGWDIDTGLSAARGMIFPIGSFGHTGFTGTSVWMDPGSDTYIVLLSNSIHTRGSPPVSNLRGDVATATAQALRL